MNFREESLSSPKSGAYRRRGMTLLEVLTAMFVLVVVFGAVLATVVNAAALTRDSKVVYRSTAIMNDLVERMRSMTFAELKAELKDGNTALGISKDVDGVAPLITTGEVPPVTPSGAGTGQVLAGAYNYKWRRTCTTPTSDPLRIEIEVWPEGLERRKISAVTYISASGLIND
jgi:prepilin-type N-terminal cleavage/methylation domain-containing protein